MANDKTKVPKKRVFIASSSEALRVAESIQAELNRKKIYFAEIWNQDVLSAGNYVMSELIKKLPDFDYALFLFASDDIVKKRGKKAVSPRDNVIFEYGLGVGILGANRCFIVKSDKVSVLSDAQGIITLEYSDDDLQKNARSAIAPAISDFENAIVGNFENQENRISWDDYCQDVKKTCVNLKKHPRRGGFTYDAIVAVTRGGIIVADMINRQLTNVLPMVCLYPDYLAAQPNTEFDGDNNCFNKGSVSVLSELKIKSVLVVDDITRTGNTIVAATQFVKNELPNCNVKSMVLYTPEKYKSRVDYYAKIISDDQIEMPYSILEK